MADFADIRLDKPDTSEGAPQRNRLGTRLAAATLIVLALAVVSVSLVRLRRSAESPASARTNSGVATVSHPLPGERAADITVPPLDESDALVRQLVSQLSKHPTVVAWLTTDHLIRNFAVVIQNIADHASPAGHLRAVRPTAAFAVGRDGARTYLDPSSYRRYDTCSDAFAAIDAHSAARLYATLKPRISEALRDLGDPRGDADATLRRAIVELLATPVIETRIPLTQPGVMYAFEDPALESLSPAQRQLLRMGPRNVRTVQQKLREIAALVGIDLSADASR